jgi:repressor LexA
MKENNLLASQPETRLQREERTEQERRIAVVKFIRSFSQEKGYAPSIRDIMPVIGVSSSATTYKVLSRMEKDELIQITQGVARSMKVLPEGKKLANSAK